LKSRVPVFDKGGAIATFLSTSTVSRGVGDIRRRRYYRCKAVSVPRQSARGGFAYSSAVRPPWRDWRVLIAASRPAGGLLEFASRKPADRGHADTKKKTESRPALIRQQLRRGVCRSETLGSVVLLSAPPPHFDSDPVFSRLLARRRGEGSASVTLANLVQSRIAVLRNTAMRRDPDRRQWRQGPASPISLRIFERFERVIRPPHIISPKKINCASNHRRPASFDDPVRPTPVTVSKPTTNFVVSLNHIRYLDGNKSYS